MRPSFLVFASLAAMAAAVLPAAGDDAKEQLPERKAGLWEQKTVMDEGNGPRDQTMKICIGAEMERNTVNASISDHKSNCASYDIDAAGGTTVVKSDCLYNGRQVISTTEMTGDFKSAFEIRIKSTTSDPAAKEQSIVVRRTITQTGKYLADSCGELKPGEAETPDGTRVLVQ